MTIDLSSVVAAIKGQIIASLPQRAMAASIELRNAALEVLRGQRTGKTYRSPTGGTYTASAPGEPPAVRTGTLRRSWRPMPHGAGNINPSIESDVKYAGYLEHGTTKMAARPFEKKIIDTAMPKIDSIYKM